MTKVFFLALFVFVFSDQITKLIAFGDNRYGQLGLGDKVTRIQPQELKGDIPSKITKIFQGYSSNFAFVDDGVYVWGYNKEGQLGLNDSLTRVSPTKHFFFQNNKEISDISISYHTFVLKEKSLFVFGNNSFGQLGLGHTTNVYFPIQHPFFIYKVIVKINTGMSHSFVLCQDNNLYVFGKNEYGQLGKGDFSNKLIPSLLDLDLMIKNTILGGYHSFIVTINNKIFATGMNEYGQLGINTTYKNVNTFTEIHPTISGSQNFSMMATGTFHTLILTNELFGFGYNQNGELGFGHTNNVDKLNPNSFFTGMFIKQIVSNGHHTFVCADDKVYSFGNGEFGQLGNSESKKVNPSPIELKHYERRNPSIYLGEMFTIISGETNVSNGSNQTQKIEIILLMSLLIFLFLFFLLITITSVYVFIKFKQSSGSFNNFYTEVE